MASELRILRFDLDEVAMALRALAPRIGLSVPEGVFGSAIPGSGEEAANTCFVVGAGPQSMVVSNGQLAASLIHYCGEIGVPIPRAGKKKIHVAQKHVELRIALLDLQAADNPGARVAAAVPGPRIEV